MPSDVHRNVIDLTHYHAKQLALGLLDLIMQTAQHPLAGFRMIVLYEIKGNAGLRKVSLLITFQKKSPFILKDSGLNH